MSEFNSRTRALFGADGVQKLKTSRVALFGLGGVGGYAFEALVRSGVGEIDIIDGDKIAESNLNRQILALNSTVGEYKTQVAKARAKDINPQAKINDFTLFVLPQNIDKFDFTKYDYVLDAIDTVSAKIAVIERAKAAGVPVISCMGTGNKTKPELLQIDDISKTSVCPLARVMRSELKKRGITNVKVVYSRETPNQAETTGEVKTGLDGNAVRPAPASCAFVPATAGLLMAGEVINYLVNRQ